MRETARTLAGRRRLVTAAVLAVVALALARFWRTPVAAPALLLTLAPSGEAGTAADSDGAGQAIARWEIGTPSRQPQLILNGFAAAGAPRVSYDGRRAIFAGRRNAHDPMQIWEVSLSTSSPRKLVDGSGCLDPAYLPDGRIVYARSLSDSHAAGPLALHTARADGSAEHRITFGKARDRAPAVLPDGRIVFRRHAPSKSTPGRIFVINPDGTSIEAFSEPSDGASIEGGPWVIDDRLVFAEVVSGVSRERLVAVSVHQPRGDREILARAREQAGAGIQRFSSVSGLPDGGLLAAAYVEGSGWTLHPLLVREAPGAGVAPGAPLPSVDDDFQPTALALAAPRPAPVALTSVVDEQKSTGTLLCLGAYASRIPEVADAPPGTIRAVRVLTADGAPLGEAPVEADGSFFIEVPADQPLHLELLGPGGVLAADHSGFWVRPNENRGCIGCHEHPELVPENRLVSALGRGPTGLAATAPGPRPEGHGQ